MRTLYASLFFLILLSCNNEKPGPDVSGIKVDLSVERFERSFFSIDTNRMLEGLQKLQGDYPKFYPLFAEVILGIPAKDIRNGMQPQAVDYQKQFFRSYAPLYDSIEEKYRKLDWLEEELEDGFRHVKYYFPSYRVPGIITYLGTFDQPAVAITPHYLAIGLQLFAGKNFTPYYAAEMQQLFPAYITRRFDREYIAPSCMMAVADDIYPDTSQSAALIDQMIEKGKQWWLLDHFMPSAHDSLITGYTAKQVEWCRKNEGNIWVSIQTNSPDLYTLDQERIQNYIGEAPFTQNMESSNSSPGNIGPWVGWQIVKKFAEENSDLSVPDILKTGSRKIFQEAKYRPK